MHQYRVGIIVFPSTRRLTKLVCSRLSNGGILGHGNLYFSIRLGPSPESDGFLLLQYHVVTDDPGKSERFRILSNGLRGKGNCDNR